jgi:hypothetical protein
VMIAVRTEIVVELPVRMDDLADQASGRKFIQIAVNGGEANAGKLLLKLLAHLFGAYVGAGPGQEIEDGHPLRGDLELQFLQHQGVIMGHKESSTVTGVRVVLNGNHFGFHSSHISSVVKGKCSTKQSGRDFGLWLDQVKCAGSPKE